MRRFFLVPLAAAVLLGQGCLADPPQPNRPIPLDFFKKNAEPLDGNLPALGGGTSTFVEPPPLKTGEFGSPSRSVVVSSIAGNQTLPNPFVILGRAAALQNTVYWRVRDDRGTDIASGSVLTDSLDEARVGAFRARAFYDRAPASSDGRVEVFTHGPGGVEQDVVVIPVTLIRELVPLKVYFIDQSNDPNLIHCDRPTAVTRRLPKTENTAEAALRELLHGPTTAESAAGSRTAIVPGTELRSVAVSGDTATVDFSRQFALGIAGSCNVQALRAQVEATLKQFSNVRNVKILVEGADAESSLQP